MAVKLDLEKAYDSISWNFLLEVLVVVGIEHEMIEIIMFYGTSTFYRYSRMVKNYQFFHQSGGSDKGDPLSP